MSHATWTLTFKSSNLDSRVLHHPHLASQLAEWLPSRQPLTWALSDNVCLRAPNAVTACMCTCVTWVIQASWLTEARPGKLNISHMLASHCNSCRRIELFALAQSHTGLSFDHLYVMATQFPVYLSHCRGCCFVHNMK